MNNQLNLVEESNFHYLLALLPPLHNEPEYSWLPELFSIIGHEKLITLCKYAGGESIKIPTLTELADSMEALEWFYKIVIEKSASVTDVPPRLSRLLAKIIGVYNVRANKEVN